MIVASQISVYIILALICVGLLWLFVRALKGKEVERRVIFLFIFVSVAAPVLVEIIFRFEPTPIVQALYDKVESLPAGSVVLLSYDFDPAMAPEVQPMADALTRHCLTKGHKIIYMCLFATGQSQLRQTFDKIIGPEFPDKVDGVDYVNIGYKAGNEGVLNIIVTNFKRMFPTDVNGVPYDSIDVFDGVISCADLDLAVSFGGGKPGVKEWVLFVGDQAGVPIGSGVAAVVAPQMYPYFPAQMVGQLGGIKGAAEYETHLMDNYPQFRDRSVPAITMMGPQTVAHIVIMAFIVIGNVLFIVSRRRGAN